MAPCYNNLDADFYYGQINESGIVEDLISRPPPEGPRPGCRRSFKGYVAGYNALPAQDRRGEHAGSALPW